jgi:hypothetical protein
VRVPRGATGRRLLTTAGDQRVGDRDALGDDAQAVDVGQRARERAPQDEQRERRDAGNQPKASSHRRRCSPRRCAAHAAANSAVAITITKR